MKNQYFITDSLTEFPHDRIINKHWISGVTSRLLNQLLGEETINSIRIELNKPRSEQFEDFEEKLLQRKDQVSFEHIGYSIEVSSESLVNGKIGRVHNTYYVCNALSIDPGSKLTKETFLRRLYNTRNISLLKTFSGSNSIFEFLFILNCYRLRDYYEESKDSQFFEGILISLPSFLFLPYEDEGGNISNPVILTIHTMLLGKGILYQKEQLDFLASSPSIVGNLRLMDGTVDYSRISFLRYFYTDFLNTIEIAKTLVTEDPCALYYFSDAIRNDYNTALIAHRAFLNYSRRNEIPFRFFEESLGHQLRSDKIFDYLEVRDEPENDIEANNEEADGDLPF